jgi:hypothetical protein
MDIYQALVYLNLIARIRDLDQGTEELSITLYDNIGGEVNYDGPGGRECLFEFRDPEDLAEKLKAELRKERG